MIFPKVELRRLSAIANGGTPTPDAVNWGGDVPWATPVDLGRVDGKTLEQTERTLTVAGAMSGSTIVPAGSVILSTRAPIGYTAIAGIATAFNQGCKALLPLGGVDSRYLRYSVESSARSLAALGRGSTFLELNSADLASHRVSAAPSAVQRQIADYLDHETAEIDAFVAELGDLKALELERRSASVSDIVWGASAQHLRTKFVADILSGFPYRSEDFVSRGSGSFRLLRGVNVGVGCIDWSDSVSAPATVIASTPEYGLQDGDLVLGLDRPIIRAGVRVALIDHASAGSYLLQRVARLRGVPGRALNRWLFHALQDRRFIAYLEPDFTGVSVPHISPGQVGEFRVPVPELDDQVRRLGLIDAIEVACDRAIADTDAAIALAKERRAALITAAVTGQIDVTARHKPVVDSIQTAIEEAR